MGRLVSSLLFGDLRVFHGVSRSPMGSATLPDLHFAAASAVMINDATPTADTLAAMNVSFLEFCRLREAYG